MIGRRRNTIEGVIVDALKSQAFINAGAINVHDNEMTAEGEGNVKEDIYPNELNNRENIED